MKVCIHACGMCVCVCACVINEAENECSPAFIIMSALARECSTLHFPLSSSLTWLIIRIDTYLLSMSTHLLTSALPYVSAERVINIKEE